MYIEAPMMSKHYNRYDNKRYDLEELCNASILFNEFLAGTIVPETIIRKELEGMFLEMRALIVSENLEPRVFEHTKTIVNTSPSNWWEHLKYTYTDKWWWPFKNIKYSIERKTAILRVTANPKLLYPEAPINTHAYFGKATRYVTYTEKVTVEDANPLGD